MNSEPAVEVLSVEKTYPNGTHVAGTGGTDTGPAYQILLSGHQLNIPRMFAALLLNTVTGVLLFAVMAWLSQ